VTRGLIVAKNETEGHGLAHKVFLAHVRAWRAKTVKWKRYGKKCSWPNLSFYPGFSRRNRGKLWKTVKISSSVNKFKSETSRLRSANHSDTKSGETFRDFFDIVDIYEIWGKLFSKYAVLPVVRLTVQRRFSKLKVSSLRDQPSAGSEMKQPT
jgi:hypothetical protein